MTLYYYGCYGILNQTTNPSANSPWLLLGNNFSTFGEAQLAVQNQPGALFWGIRISSSAPLTYQVVYTRQALDYTQLNSWSIDPVTCLTINGHTVGPLEYRTNPFYAIYNVTTTSPPVTVMTDKLGTWTIVGIIALVLFILLIAVIIYYARRASQVGPNMLASAFQ